MPANITWPYLPAAYAAARDRSGFPWPRPCVHQLALPSNVGARMLSSLELEADILCVWKKSPDAESMAVIVSGDTSLC